MQKHLFVKRVSQVTEVNVECRDEKIRQEQVRSRYWTNRKKIIGMVGAYGMDV